ncbi:MAG TPA: POTRA domain-containing protein, partial [Bacteroidia bacterium]|nr:POTRA domain-containing protein [Bacteroidia bacterium]
MFKRALLINLFFAFCFSSFASDSLQVDTSTIYVRQIVVTGNKVTRYSVIQRELAFSQGQTMKVAELDEKITKSRENLLNISLFNFVNINKQLIGNDVYVIIDVVERWYIFPVPIFEVVDRNFWEWWRDKNL